MPRTKPNSAAVVSRLNRVAGQVAGVARMVEEERYCVDILTQLRAIKSALSRVEDMVLQDHAGSCVAEAIRSGDPAEQRRKFEELITLMGKFKS